MTRENFTRLSCDRCGDSVMRAGDNRLVADERSDKPWDLSDKRDLCPTCKTRSDEITIRLFVAGSHLNFTIKELADELHRVVDHIGRLPDKRPHQALCLQDREQKVRVVVLVNKNKWERET